MVLDHIIAHEKGMPESSWLNSEPECKLYEVIFLLFPPDLFSVPKTRLSHKWVLDKYLRGLLNKWVNHRITMDTVQLGYPIVDSFLNLTLHRGALSHKCNGSHICNF